MTAIKDYIEDSAGWIVWIGAGMALLVVLACIGLLYMVHHHRRQDAVLTQIDRRLAEMDGSVGFATGGVGLEEGPSYEDVIDSFFAETEVLSPSILEEAEQEEPAATRTAGIGVSPAASEEPSAPQEEAPAAMPPAMPAAPATDTQRTDTQQEESPAPAPTGLEALQALLAERGLPQQEEAAFDFSAFKANLEGPAKEGDSLYDTARSGRRYSRAELEKQIKG